MLSKKFLSEGGKRRNLGTFEKQGRSSLLPYSPDSERY